MVLFTDPAMLIDSRVEGRIHERFEKELDMLGIGDIAAVSDERVFSNWENALDILESR